MTDDQFPEPHMDPLERAMQEDGLLSTDRPLHCEFPKCGCGSNPCRATLSPVEGTLGYLTPEGFHTIAPSTNAYTIVIHGEGAKPLLTLKPDGTIETAIEYADEAARVFLGSLSDKWRLILDAAPLHEGEGEPVCTCPEPGARRERICRKCYPTPAAFLDVARMANAAPPRAGPVRSHPPRQRTPTRWRLEMNRPALRHLLSIIARCLSTGVLAGAAMSIYWNTLPAPPNGEQFLIGLAVMFSVIFVVQTITKPDGEKT